jgi:hypothetical protein
LQVIVAQLGLRHAANGQTVRVGLSIGLHDHDHCRQFQATGLGNAGNIIPESLPPAVIIRRPVALAKLTAQDAAPWPGPVSGQGRT